MALSRDEGGFRAALKEGIMMSIGRSGGQSSPSVEICAICAWRAGCQKKFSISGRDVRCPDFVKDISIKNEKEGKQE